MVQLHRFSTNGDGFKDRTALPVTAQGARREVYRTHQREFYFLTPYISSHSLRCFFNKATLPAGPLGLVLSQTVLLGFLQLLDGLLAVVDLFLELFYHLRVLLLDLRLSSSVTGTSRSFTRPATMSAFARFLRGVAGGLGGVLLFFNKAGLVIGAYICRRLDISIPPPLRGAGAVFQGDADGRQILARLVRQREILRLPSSARRRMTNSINCPERIVALGTGGGQLRIEQAQDRAQVLYASAPRRRRRSPARRSRVFSTGRSAR